MPTEAFSERLQRLRYAKDMTCKELAEQTGICNRTLVSYEYGEYCPSADKLSRLARVLGVTMDYLWEGESNGE